MDCGPRSFLIFPSQTLYSILYFLFFRSGTVVCRLEKRRGERREGRIFSTMKKETRLRPHGNRPSVRGNPDLRDPRAEGWFQSSRCFPGSREEAALPDDNFSDIRKCLSKNSECKGYAALIFRKARKKPVQPANEPASGDSMKHVENLYKQIGCWRQCRGRTVRRSRHRATCEGTTKEARHDYGKWRTNLSI